MRMERDGELAIVRMEAGKANAMTRAMLDGLCECWDEVAETDARAIVLTGDGRAFSAGLALPELIELERPAMREAIDRFTRAMVRVFATELPVVAAIDGHAIAGGCVLACQCDARIAADAALRIGLNEVQLGIGFPAIVLEPLRLFLPPASFGAVGLEGRLFAPAEARALGLVDEVVPPAELHARACARARTLASVPSSAFAQVKAAWRGPAMDAMARGGDDVRERWLDTWFAPEAQARLRATVIRLTSRA
jgi:enoyl-CoA hydratase